MTGVKKMMTAMKRAVSPMKPRKFADENSVSVMMEHTPLTRFVMDRLTGASQELFLCLLQFR